jgi:hypothetical protein
MSAKSLKRGNITFKKLDIQGVSRLGLWVLVHEKEFFVPFDAYPWFLKGTLQQIYNAQLIGDHHLHWPDLDIDIEVDALINPDAYPLRYS